jgi:hypothetical protein
MAQRRAAERALAAQREAARRRRRWWTSGSISAVVLAIAVLVAVHFATSGGASATQQGADPAATTILPEVTAVSQDLLNQVGKGSGVDNLPKAVTGEPALTADGKPLVLYEGAEYCPFCAAQHWALVVALTRFGSFENLGTTHSSASDTYPNTATLDFHGSTYTSDYITFQGVETQSNIKSGNGYAALDTLTADQQAVVNKYNATPYLTSDQAGAIPFLDFGNRFLVSGASYSPQLITGMQGADIATALSDPTSAQATAILGAANAFTAAICVMTGGQPGNVCTAAGTAAYADTIHA